MLDVGTEDGLFSDYANAHRLLFAPAVREDNFLRPLLERMAQQISRFPAQGTERNRPSIRLGFLERPSPNAFADLWKEGAVIGIHPGLLRSIFETIFTGNAQSIILEIAQTLVDESDAVSVGYMTRAVCQLCACV